HMAGFQFERLETHTIQVWFASVRPLTAHDFGFLTDDEKKRAARFRFEKDRQSFVLGKRVLRTVLGHALGTPATDVIFRAGAHGKPELANADTGNPVTFNLSHSGTQIAAAVAFDRRIGIDIERCELTGRDVFEIARHFFSAPEIASLEADPAKAPDLFFRYWTAKEAFLKAHGSGLGTPLDSID